MIRSSNVCRCAVVLATLGFAASSAIAQDGGGGDGGVNVDTNAGSVAGIEVDANGVLRTRVFRDRSGQLSRRRIQQLAARKDPKLASPSKLRKVSLNRLEEALATRLSQGGDATDAMRNLAGLTRLQYVFFYPETNDIVIAGPAEGFINDAAGHAVGMNSGSAVLQLEDLIVALRAFGPDGVATEIISCSIDPTQDGLQRMQQFLVNISGRVAPHDDRRIAHGLRESLGLQTVSVRGVAPETHFAQVLVEADYRMKLIGIGLEKAPVPITSYVKRARPANVARNALQRWYFVPDYESIKMSEDQLAIELIGNGAKLIGEDEHVGVDGSRVRSGRADRASQMFVQSFTKRFAELSRRVPVYGQLRNVIDLAIAAAHIQQEDFYSRSGWSLGVFAREDVYPVQIHNAPEKVETAVNVVWKGRTLMTPVGGGVNIEARRALQGENVATDDDGELGDLRGTIDVRGLDAGQWWWD